MVNYYKKHPYSEPPEKIIRYRIKIYRNKVEIRYFPF